MKQLVITAFLALTGTMALTPTSEQQLKHER
jgi:hypothetical protein